MVNTSHSRSVRGTLSHPSSSSPSSSPSSSQPPPSLSDATSLTPENASIRLPLHDSAPPPSPSKTPASSPSPVDSASPADSAPTPSTPYRTLGTAAGGSDKRAVGNRAVDAAEGTARDSAQGAAGTTGDVAGNAALKAKGKGEGEEEEEEEEVHSRRVRGTLGNKKREGRVEKTMLGDPASLTVEGGGYSLSDMVVKEKPG